MASVHKRIAKEGRATWLLTWREDGRQRGITYTNRKAAERARLRVLANDGRLPDELMTQAPPDVPTLAEAVTHHLEQLTGANRQTLATYRRIVDQHILPTIGGVPIDMLDRHRVAGWFNQLDPTLALKTRRNIHSVLSAALTTAQDEGWIAANPARRLRMPRDDTAARGQMVCMTHAEFAAVRDHLDPHYTCLATVLVASGARFGEATALTPADFTADPDLRVTIRRAWKRPPSGWEIGATKTRRSDRIVDLPNDLIPMLMDHMRGLDARSLMFTAHHGGRVTHGAFYRCWKRAVVASGIAVDPRVHDLRHSFASWQIAAGVPLTTIQHRMGHESIRTTSDTYGHLMPGAQATAVSAIGRMLALGTR